MTAVAFADPVTPAYVRQVRFVLAMVGPGVAAPRLGPSPALDAGLRGLGGADVLLIFVESYGAVTYETPAIAAGLAESRADFEAAIRETGRQVVSAYVESPTFGGWLVAGAPEPDVGRRGTRPVRIHVADGVAGETRSSRTSRGAATARWR